MPQTCTVCAHPKTKDIEQDIVNNKAHTQIAKKFGLNHHSVRYHSMNHLPEKLVQSVQDKQKKHTRGILEGIEALLSETETILKEAREKGQNRLALDAIKEGRNTYELLSKIAVKLREYQKSEESKKDDAATQKASEGLKVLSDNELKAYIQLTAKITKADPDYELDHESRMFVEGVERMRGYHQREFVDSDSPQNSERQPQNSLNEASDNEDLQLDDLDDFDLAFDSDDDTIPSEETDPKWLVRERNR